MCTATCARRRRTCLADAWDAAPPPATERPLHQLAALIELGVDLAAARRPGTTGRVGRASEAGDAVTRPIRSLNSVPISDLMLTAIGGGYLRNPPRSRWGFQPIRSMPFYAGRAR